MKQTVTVYTQTNCRPCGELKAWLEGMEVEFTSININEDEKAKNHVVEELGLMSTPVTEIGDKVIVGFTPQTMKEIMLTLDM